MSPSYVSGHSLSNVTSPETLQLPTVFSVYNQLNVIPEVTLVAALFFPACPLKGAFEGETS